MARTDFNKNSWINEVHNHSNENWFGKAATPNGEVHAADHIGTSTTPFQIDGGNNSWGAWVCILGSSDGSGSGQKYFDPHRALIVDAERTSSNYLIQIASGATTAADALTARSYTELVYRALATGNTEVPVMIQSKRIPFGQKVWVRCWCVGQNTGTLDFFWAAHGYTN